jgi:hypothetical protein
MRAACPHCGRQGNLAAEAAGQKVRCPGCYGSFQLPPSLPSLRLGLALVDPPARQKLSRKTKDCWPPVGWSC